MKILHTSDWHLGAMDGNHSLKEDQEFFINQICRIVQTEQVDAVVIAGDVYDRSVASAEAIRLYDYAMTRLCVELNTPVLSIAGNHDSAERLGSCRDLLSAAGLYVAGSLRDGVQMVPFEDTDIYLLPWITEERVKSVFPEKKEEITSLEDAYRVVTDTIRAGFAPDKKHIIVSHAFITNSETSTSDRAAEIGFATQVSASVFDGFDYVALGHIHKPQDITATVRYSGTPMPYSFGKEETQEKSVTIVDTADMSHRIVPLQLLHARTTLTGTLDALLNPDYPKEVQEGYVRLVVTDHYVGMETMSMFRQIYPAILDFTSKQYENEKGTTIMTMEEFEQLENNPLEVFKSFCREALNQDPDQHLLTLFEEAVRKTEEEQA